MKGINEWNFVADMKEILDNVKRDLENKDIDRFLEETKKSIIHIYDYNKIKVKKSRKNALR